MLFGKHLVGHPASPSPDRVVQGAFNNYYCRAGPF